MYSRPTFWLEFRLLSDGLQTGAVHTLPLTVWHERNTRVFSLFSALPTELRLKVWEYLIAPRIVGIACLCLEDDASSVETQREDLWGPHPAIRPAVPVLLHINRETRALALKHYELSFEWKVPRVLAGADMHPPVRLRSPILAAPSPPAIMPESTTERSQPTNDPSLPHISSYHDLLDPSPRPSTSGVGGGGGERRAAEAASTANGSTTRTSGGTSANPIIFSPERRTSSPPRTWFNFALDAVYLLGELEPCDSFGFNSPMTYFIPSQTARRVRKAAVSFGALRYGETFGQQETVLPWTTFVSEMNKFAVGDTPDWCRVCGVTTGSCASTSSGSDSGSGASTTKSGNSNNISLPVAGVIGALVTLAVVLGAEALIYFISGVTLVKKSTLAATTPGTKA
ncbi:4-nitrophenylphosphatase/Acid phosphatase [Xylaria longipes]|nr:4-nitrophenylphosphatase/Acid phosphatase [Xylaria longipes]